MISGYQSIAGSDVGHKHAADPRTIGCFLHAKRTNSTARMYIRVRGTHPRVAAPRGVRVRCTFNAWLHRDGRVIAVLLRKAFASWSKI